jgi:E3 ubiquitin-protein ligase RNF5
VVICFGMSIINQCSSTNYLDSWPCLYKWLNASNNKSLSCPVCKAGIEKDKIIPIYGRGGSTSSQKSANIHSAPSSSNEDDNNNNSEQSATTTTTATHSEIPNRPRGQRPQATPNPNYNPFASQQQHFPFQNAFGIGGGAHTGPMMGNFQFAEGFSFFPFFGFHTATWSNFRNQSSTTTTTSATNNQQQQAVNDRDLFDDDALQRHFLSRLLCLLGVLVILTILFM